jgi:hypothetical protein
LFDGDVRSYGTKERGQRHKAKQVLGSLLTAREVAAATLMFNSTTFADTAKNRITVGSNLDWGHANGVPLDNITTAIGMLTERGFDPATLSILLPSKTHRVLSLNAQMRTKVVATPVYASTGAKGLPVLLPEQILAGLFGVKEVIIQRGVKDTANKGAASVFAPIWDPTMAMVAYLGANAEDDAGLGHTFVTDQGMDTGSLADASGLPVDPALMVQVDQYREEKLTADVIRVRDCLDMKLTNTDAAVLLTGVTV